ncbi:MAG: VCBS repeat-containing protein [Planctomycetes bacterium]|nr:VCBS repeat-containing protein [Planctomycetota bacterium]
MNIYPNRKIYLCIMAMAVLASLPCRRAQAYVEAPFSLGKIVNSSSMIVMVRVKSVDRTKNLIVYSKVRDVRGTFPGDEIMHNIGQRGFHPREWKNIMAWARVGKMALFFTAGGHGEMCIDNYWYQCGFKGWATMTHAEPYFLRAFAGKPEKLASYVTAMLAGQEVVVPCMVDGDKMAIQTRTAKIQRMRASLKIGDYNPKRDFVGWGAEDFRPITGMPGFTHYSAIGKFSPGAAGVAPADINNDGKIDLCIFGDYKMSLLKNDGGILGEEMLPVSGGARAAVWGDYDSDGIIDLLVASSTGIKLLRNNKKQFADATAQIPLDAYSSPRAAAWIDYDGDKKLDILLADGFRGLRLYRNVIPKGQTATKPAKLPLFTDVSDAAGLGAKGIGANMKGDHLAVADVNGDGRPDVLYSTGSGMLLLNTPKGFVHAKDSGISYVTGRIAPVFGDYNGDGHPDLFVPQKGTCKLLKNDGRGRFTDVTAASGDLARPVGWARCAAWTDFNGDKRPDLFIGCLKGPNRYFQGNADGTFTDASEAIGLMYRMYNTCGMAVADTNADDMPDLVFNNEGQAAVVLLGNPAGVNGEKENASVSALPSLSALTGASLAGGVPPGIDKLTSGGSKLFYWLAAIVLAGILGVVAGVVVIRHLRIRHAGGRIENESHHRTGGLV